MSDSLIDFDKKCIDPLARIILQASLEYVIETSGLKEAQPAIKNVRDELSKIPVCKSPLIKEKPTVSKMVEAPKIEEMSRTQPGLWGKAYFKGEGKEAKLTGEYDSPGTLAKALGIKTRGARTMKESFERAGFEVRGDGEEVEKGKTGFIVKRVAKTPYKWRLPLEELEEFYKQSGYVGRRDSE